MAVIFVFPQGGGPVTTNPKNVLYIWKSASGFVIRLPNGHETIFKPLEEMADAQIPYPPNWDEAFAVLPRRERLLLDAWTARIATIEADPFGVSTRMGGENYWRMILVCCAVQDGSASSIEAALCKMIKNTSARGILPLPE